ncbi:crotonobetainyl-CoA:carnitine CoA-transferase CaiB-like acyl-CoA transferase [Mycobacterium frederiksbergense]|uniref:Crotonobetainyl-CoA:carnitine CoA-transferase CaiB-like acyl-CoA transferase n=1 Tax=Mycolicibacterium frederiksbergense TaxID=117567 RepID=A0ABT6L5I6_9MYCO|nr:CoA transferase [Mycolicibacterium frederiksbergense]MDH6198189.1 crotonobetainyl-CoA:carnitine CoA-transferase CaiB-like acyl-CoA transferase [Mycolicibacterium frederiksbergense]
MSVRQPLAGLRVLDYAQYVAGPFAAMLLADLGAEVIKVEPPRGDAWRHYEPLTPDGGKWFLSLNRNKKSVIADLKTEEGQQFSKALIRSADVVIHNMPPGRARSFGLDKESVAAVNPQAVWCCVSAFGSDGPDASTLGYDLIAQAASGLLLADARPGDEVPRRSGGIAMADLTAGLLTFSAALIGLVDRLRGASPDAPARGIEVSLLGAALAVQVQRFVELSGDGGVDDSDTADGSFCDDDRLVEIAAAVAESDDLEPYYRCYRASDGYIALACLNLAQRVKVQHLLGIDDPWAVNPQAAPADESERVLRSGLKDRFAEVISTRPVRHWIARFEELGIPGGPVHEISHAHRSEQVRANGLVQTIDQPGVGTVSLLGSLFKIDGRAAPHARTAPRLGEHTEEMLEQLSQLQTSEGTAYQ